MFLHPVEDAESKRRKGKKYVAGKLVMKLFSRL